jgi:hypothetical protein
MKCPLYKMGYIVSLDKEEALKERLKDFMRASTWHGSFHKSHVICNL